MSRIGHLLRLFPVVVLSSGCAVTGGAPSRPEAAASAAVDRDAAKPAAQEAPAEQKPGVNAIAHRADGPGKSDDPAQREAALAAITGEDQGVVGKASDDN